MEGPRLFLTLRLTLRGVWTVECGVRAAAAFCCAATAWLSAALHLALVSCRLLYTASSLGLFSHALCSVIVVVCSR